MDLTIFVVTFIGNWSGFTTKEEGQHHSSEAAWAMDEITGNQQKS